MNLTEVLNHPEGRRLEFKSELPLRAELARTIISFANDAGGTLYIGIKDNPREVVGIREEDLIQTEETISNIIFDQCTPPILPEIQFINYNEKYVIAVRIFKGSTPPYHQKNRKIEEGTYLRVGSTNRNASQEIIAELERQKQNISFDSELVYKKSPEDLDLQSFKNLYKEKTGESCSNQLMAKLSLIKEEQGKTLPTKALLLLSEDQLRGQYFPYGKIECARFKGTDPGIFIDNKTINQSIAIQAEQAYQFVLRHISQSSMEYNGVYRSDHWEYPIIAIREAIRNAVIHRDYSLTGKDIKIAIFDDKIEITSPGKLMPSVDYNDMMSGQSEIRNRILAPVFKRLGIIEQWGNGLKLISRELESYPDIELIWTEPGIAFRVIFKKKNYRKIQDSVADSGTLDIDSGPGRDHDGTRTGPGRDQVKELLIFCREPRSIQKIMELKKWSNRTKFRNKYIKPLIQQELIQMTIPQKPSSKNQQYVITKRGLRYLEN